MNRIFLLVMVLSLAACANQKKASKQQAMANEPFLIYKTKADYNQLVPVILNDDKTEIVAYPAPADLKSVEGLRTPLELKNGYLLDVRGIGPNVAFTSFTYETYARLKQAPVLEELFRSIVDKDPLLEMYDCKNFLDIKYNLKEVNKLVKKKLDQCVKIK
ncbi:MAG: hypothetical protein JXR22_13775 [Prolixibacteraceae bacterium]|nr:hypothetical protein [Prolixibacteraceae bacterium]